MRKLKYRDYMSSAIRLLSYGSKTADTVSGALNLLRKKNLGTMLQSADQLSQLGLHWNTWDGPGVCFFLNIFVCFHFYLKTKIQSKKETKRTLERYPPSVSSPSKCLQHPGLGQVKAAAWNSMWVSGSQVLTSFFRVTGCSPARS